MRRYSTVVLLVAATSATAQVRPFQEVRLDTEYVCKQLANPANDPVVAAILRSQLSGIDIDGTQVGGIRDRIGPRACNQETLQDGINYVLHGALERREIRGVELDETDTSRQTFVDGTSPPAAAAATAAAPPAAAGLPGVPAVGTGELARELTDKVEELGAGLNQKINGLALEVRQLQQLNLPKRPMQLGSEIVYTYAAIVGRRWTPSTEVLIDGKLCGKKGKDGEKQDNRRCRVVELKEEGQFACWDLDLFYRTCYELTLEQEVEDGNKQRVKSRFDVTRARDDLPSQVYLPMLADAEKHAGTQPVVGDTTYQRLVNVQRSRNEHDYERTRAHLGALAAVNAEHSQSLLTAAALHLYLSEQPWLPGRLDLVRRMSLMVLYGNLDLGPASAKTLGVGVGIDIVRGFSFSIGYSRYTLDAELDPSIPAGTEVQTGGGFAGLSINTEIVNNNKSLAGFFGQ